MTSLKFEDFIDLFAPYPLPHDARSRLLTRIQATPQPDEDLIIRYLEAPLGFAGSQFYVDQFMQGELVEPIEYRSDGDWCWSNALAYYVQRYHFKISFDFAQHIKHRNGIAPTRGEIDWNRVEREFFRGAEGVS